MKVYIVFSVNEYYVQDTIQGIFIQEKDAKDLLNSFNENKSDYFIQEHEVIE